MLINIFKNMLDFNKYYMRICFVVLADGMHVPLILEWLSRGDLCLFFSPIPLQKPLVGDIFKWR